MMVIIGTFLFLGAVIGLGGSQILLKRDMERVANRKQQSPLQY